MLDKVATLPHVRSVTSPFTAAGADQISTDGTVAFATVDFDAAMPRTCPRPRCSRSSPLPRRPADQPAPGGAGRPGHRAAPGPEPARTAPGIGIVLALIVLGIAFGALFAAFLPLITALVAIGVGYSLTGLLSHAFSVASFATILGVLIGLGVGVDYALFIVTRHRTGLKGGRSVEDAAVNAVNTAGRAVFFAGITVCIALLGQFALGVSFLYGIAVSAAVTVALTMLASLTLLPALLGFFGMKVLSRRQRAELQATGPVAEAASPGSGIAGPTASSAGRCCPPSLALAAVVVIALPIFSLRLGLDDAGSDPAGTTTRQAYDLLAKGFGPGFNGPFQLVAELPSPADEAAFAAVLQRSPASRAWSQSPRRC